MSGTLVVLLLAASTVVVAGLPTRAAAPTFVEEHCVGGGGCDASTALDLRRGSEADNTDDEPPNEPCQCTGALNRTFPIQVYVGLYVTGLTDMDAEAQTFVMSGTYWYRWKTCSSIDGKTQYDPNTYVRMVSMTSDWASTFYVNTYCANNTKRVCARCLADGYSYARVRFNAPFETAFDYRRFPLDKQHMLIHWEDEHHHADHVRLLPDDDSAWHPGVQLPGWKIESKMQSAHHIVQLRTHFGLGDHGGESAAGGGGGGGGHDAGHRRRKRSDHGGGDEDPDLEHRSSSRVEIGVVIHRNPTYFFCKVMPPMLIALGAGFSVLLLDPTKSEFRIELCLAALLTLVFMDSDVDRDAADSTMNVADWLFNWAYLLVLAVTLESIWVGRVMHSIEHAQLLRRLGLDEASVKSEAPPPAGADDVPLLDAQAKDSGAVGGAGGGSSGGVGVGEGAGGGHGHIPSKNELLASLVRKQDNVRRLDFRLGIVLCVLAVVGITVTLLAAAFAVHSAEH